MQRPGVENCRRWDADEEASEWAFDEGQGLFHPRAGIAAGPIKTLEVWKEREVSRCEIE